MQSSPTQPPQQIVGMRNLSTSSTACTGKLALMLLIYDGQCDFCIRSAAWIRARLPATARVEPWQEVALERLGLNEADVQTSVWWIEGTDTDVENTNSENAELHNLDHLADLDASKIKKSSGAQAIGRSLLAAGGSWALVGRVLIHPPVSWLAEPAYSWVAANRHRLSRMHKS